ncbi:hypothetical protein ACRAWF_12335 [Streptomyces sp. L7]
MVDTYYRLGQLRRVGRLVRTCSPSTRPWTNSWPDTPRAARPLRTR